MRKIMILVSEISEEDFVTLARKLALTCENHARDTRSDILVIATLDGSPDPQDRPNSDPAAN